MPFFEIQNVSFDFGYMSGWRIYLIIFHFTFLSVLSFLVSKTFQWCQLNTNFAHLDKTILAIWAFLLRSKIHAFDVRLHFIIKWKLETLGDIWTVRWCKQERYLCTSGELFYDFSGTYNSVYLYLRQDTYVQAISQLICTYAKVITVYSRISASVSTRCTFAYSDRLLLHFKCPSHTPRTIFRGKTTNVA